MVLGVDAVVGFLAHAQEAGSLAARHPGMRQPSRRGVPHRVGCNLFDAGACAHIREGPPGVPDALAVCTPSHGVGPLSRHWQLFDGDIFELDIQRQMGVVSIRR